MFDIPHLISSPNNISPQGVIIPAGIGIEPVQPAIMIPGMGLVPQMGYTVIKGYIPSGARTATFPATPDNYLIQNIGWSALIVLASVTVNPGSAETLLLRLRTSVPTVPATFFNVGIGTANAFSGGSGTMSLVVGRGAVTAWNGTTAANTLATVLPHLFYVDVFPSASGSWTYSVDLILIP